MELKTGGCSFSILVKHEITLDLKVGFNDIVSKGGIGRYWKQPAMKAGGSV